MPYKKKESLFNRALAEKKRATAEFSTEITPSVMEAHDDSMEMGIPRAAKSPRVKREKPQSTKAAGSVAWKVVFILLTVAAIAAASVYGYFSFNDYNTQLINKESAALSTLNQVIVPENHFTVTSAHDFTFLQHLKAAKLQPGVDLYTNPDATAEELGAEVDKIITDIQSLNFNAIILDTRLNDSVVFKTNSLKQSASDLLALTSEKAKAAGLGFIAVLNMSDVALPDGKAVTNCLAQGDKLALYGAAADLAGYKLDAILLDGYYIDRGGDSYGKFVEYGAVGNYDDWVYNNTQLSVKGVRDAVETANGAIPTGIVLKDVWASEEAGGPKTTAEFTALKNGNVDTKKLIEDGVARFASVEVDTSLTDKAKPFETVSKWWAEVCQAANMPMYVTHYAKYAGDDTRAGWSGDDQLARQLAKAMELPGYKGSAYVGLQSMIDNKDTSTDYLMKVYDESYNISDLFQDLTLSSPTKPSFVTYEENVQFRGKFDPNQDVFLNGEKIVPSERGGFSVWVPLKVGKNQIVLEHKGQKITYNVERRVIIFKEVKPTGDMKVSGGSQIEVNVLGYKDSKITATFNGQTITLQEGGGEDTQLDSNYIYYVGHFTAPKATPKDQPIGAITFNGLYQGYPEKKVGANITVNKLIDAVDPDEATGQVMQHATITSTYAYTYPFNTTPGYPQGVLYQLPAGVQDIVQSINGDFVNLRSGKTVKMKDVSLTDIPFVGNNNITQFTAGVEGNDTVLRMTMGWKAPFSVELSPYVNAPEELGKNYNFGASTVTIYLDYMTMHDKESFSDAIANSPLFSSMNVERIKNQERNIWQYKITLPLRAAGRYYGVHAQYEDNTLVFKFNNPPAAGTLSGLTIMVDPGHGGKDNGTMAGRDTLEKDVNLTLANKVAAQLQALGANVVMSRNSDETISDESRIERFYAAQPDMVLAIHHNSAGANASPSGVETYYNTPFSQPLASAIQAQLGQYLTNRGWKHYNFFQTRGKQYPSVLIEYAFLSNPNDEALALNPQHQDTMAYATAQGVLNYYS